MKKVFALLMVLVLACALCVPALAAGTSYNKKQLEGLVAKAPADVQPVASKIVKALKDTDSLTVDVDEVKRIYNSLKTTLSTEKDAGKIKTAIENAANSMKTATGLEFRNLSVNVDAVNGNISVSADVVKNGDTIVSITESGKAAQINNSGSSSSTTSNTAAAASSVIKATGFDTTAVVMVILTIAGVLGVATVKARKLD